MSRFPTPHKSKLLALVANRRLHADDKIRVEEALSRYEEWISELVDIPRGAADTVERLVESTNRYKRFIEVDLIFDSPHDFLYRQKGQLKLDNTIIEEFLPYLIYQSVETLDDTYELGPRKTFSGLSFLSSIGSTGNGGTPLLRSKDQDFIVGKRLYMKSSFTSDFNESDSTESHLGFVCVECKTNLDKTMFQEAVATSRDLKIAVPGSLYFLVCEFLDMTPVSITSTQIDDVLIARKAKRLSSNVRQNFTNAEARRSNRTTYLEYLDESNYSAAVFQRMIEKIRNVTRDSSPTSAQVLQQGFF